MTENNLLQVEARIARTTQGTWEQRGGYIHIRGQSDPCVIDCLSQRTYDFQANAEFICSAREDITELIDEVRRLRSALDTILQTAKDIIDHGHSSSDSMAEGNPDGSRLVVA